MVGEELESAAKQEELLGVKTAVAWPGSEEAALPVSAYGRLRESMSATAPTGKRKKRKARRVDLLPKRVWGQSGEEERHPPTSADLVRSAARGLKEIHFPATAVGMGCSCSAGVMDRTTTAGWDGEGSEVTGGRI